MEFGWNVALLTNQSDYWRRQRREIHRFLGAANLGTYFPVLERQARRYLRRMLDEPNKFSEHAHL